MARLISKGGNFTAAGSWGAVETATGAQQTTRSAATGNTTSYVYSPTFTITNGSVIEGVMLWLEQNGSGTGTFSVALSDDNGVTATREVTINVSDVPPANSDGGWVFFKFGSTLTGDGGTDYRIGVKGSSISQVTTARSATAADWARLLRTSTTQAPAAADELYIVGEHTAAGAVTTITITMNNANTTAFGLVEVGHTGVLSWDTTAASTFTLRLAGSLSIRYAGTVKMGDTGAEIPRDSVAILEFDCGSDGQYYLDVWGTFKARGLSRTAGKDIVWCRLNTDEAAAQTTLGVDTDTGWKSGDEIAIASTTRTVGQLEERTLSGDAGASSITVSSGLTNAHGGTAPVQAHVALLTRNVRVRSTSSTFASRVLVNISASFDVEWVDFRYCGYGTGVYALNLSTTTMVPKVRYCLIRDSDGGGINQTNNNSYSMDIRDTCIYKQATAAFNTDGITMGSNQSASTWVISNVLLLGGGNNGSYGFNLAGSPSTSMTITGLIVANGNWFGALGCVYDDYLLDGFELYSNTGTHVIYIANTPQKNLSFKNFSVWRNNISVMSLTSFPLPGISWEDGKFFGNTTAHITLGNAANAPGWRFKNVIFAGDTTFSTTYGISIGGGSNASNTPDWRFEGCTFGDAAGGIYADHTTNDILLGAGIHYTTMTVVGANGFGAATPVGGMSQAIRGSYIAVQSSSGATIYTPFGTLARDTTTFDVTPSLKMTPSVAATKLESNAGTRGKGFLVPVNNGQTVTASIKVQKDGSYNGNAPRLIVKSNPLVGIDDDTVIDTHATGSGSFETLSGAAPAVSADGVLEFVVDCDGTAGNIYVDTFGASV
jgi:hypothetical protein